MRNGRLIRAALVCLAVVGMCVPEVALAVTPGVQPAVTDIALGQNGIMQGKVVDPQTGAGVANTPVTLRVQDQIVATTTTDANGKFAVQGLRGGVHQVIAAEGHGIYRLWTAGTAPPAAQVEAVVYNQTANAVGPNVPVTYTSMKTLLINPIVIGGVIATAIAVPVALNNTSSSSP